MRDQVAKIRENALQASSNSSSVRQLNEARVKYLGKKGELTKLLRGMGKLPKEQRPVFGRLVNEVRDELEQAWQKKEQELFAREEEKRLLAESLDITLPGRMVPRGTAHPLTQVIDETKAIFTAMGYEIVEGPEIEWDYYNFEALNIPPDHPARDMQDTFFFTEKILLRSQTSPVQIRVMEKQDPPV
ncbi:MAG TPA: phenylalanine--tRNA ligase subunit alpha, partial [Firmicutes bacterium]|nr:phenylalanine--tRNA ligase subunit alpha [Bacillota bacterium]